MNKINNTGLDIDGYIINKASYGFISEDYKIVLDSIIDILTNSRLNYTIHSIYLYGSIPKGRAIKFQSDLDLIIITNTSNIQTKILEDIKQITLKKFDYITKIDMPVCELEKVNDPENTYDIAFRIKNSGICIYGSDIYDSITKFKPTKEVAFAFNKEIPELIDKYKDYFNRITDDKLMILLSKQISKKIIRSLFGSIIEDKKVWCDSFEEMSINYSFFYPDDEPEITNLSKIAKEGTTNKSEILKLIDRFEHKLKIFYKIES